MLRTATQKTPALILLSGILVLISSAAQTATGAKKASPRAVSHTTVVCRTDGLCKTVVRPGPAPYHYVHHGCGMSSLASCRGGAYVKGVDF